MLSITLESDLFGETAKALLLDFPEWSEWSFTFGSGCVGTAYFFVKC